MRVNSSRIGLYLCVLVTFTLVIKISAKRDVLTFTMVIITTA